MKCLRTMICSQQLLRLFSMSGGGGGPQTPMNMGEMGLGSTFLPGCGYDQTALAENCLDFQRKTTHKATMLDQQTLLWKSILQRLSFVCCSSGVRY
ncbi:hypothetical protein DY000_02053009 [Brassica cretica]|uniref:Uncharacterized protein n=1 Tax=Brassica cretica TaxID=69181 RepID=A0ABQ7AMW7_BRACR|nr:hypothetical protein DY000_02053009 [Brassica cretica]